VTLEAGEVREAAEFLRTHPFDELWRAAAGGVAAHWCLPEPEVRDLFAHHYRRVLDFYERAADSGDAVVKRFLYSSAVCRRGRNGNRLPAGRGTGREAGIMAGRRGAAPRGRQPWWG
jgi:hypothetical protein